MTPAVLENGELETRYRQGRWDSSLLDSALTQAENSGRSSDWIIHFDICQALRGLTLRDWQHVANHYLAADRASPKLWLKLLDSILSPTLFPELSNEERQRRHDALISPVWQDPIACARDVLQSGYLGSRLSHYPCLLTQGESMRLPVVAKGFPVGKRRRQAARQLLSLTQPFEVLIRECLSRAAGGKDTSYRPTVAVVGNSPSILTAGRGDEIDSADLVIRFNKVSMEPNKIRHTGRRTDIWVMSPSTPVSCCPADAKGIIVSGLDSLTRPSFFWPTLPGPGKPLSQCPASQWHELVACFRAPPSAGTLLLASLKAMDLDVSCHGFTRCVTEHAVHGNHHADDDARSVRHNWEAEACWLGNLFPQREAFIVSSE
ncbi:glycosyltransferase family 29 protein [Granulosicoccus sp. 3-233]|uniref:glycosyltransferase family 29 protein n=1 Tax=Granulosicoccus sp. 3-233 TaxID=3417969 RepID=UPI003D325170